MNAHPQHKHVAHTALTHAHRNSPAVRVRLKLQNSKTPINTHQPTKEEDKNTPNEQIKLAHTRVYLLIEVIQTVDGPRRHGARPARPPSPAEWTLPLPDRPEVVVATHRECSQLGVDLMDFWYSLGSVFLWFCWCFCLLVC